MQSYFNPISLTEDDILQYIDLPPSEGDSIPVAEDKAVTNIQQADSLPLSSPLPLNEQSSSGSLDVIKTQFPSVYTYLMVPEPRDETPTSAGNEIQELTDETQANAENEVAVISSSQLEDEEIELNLKKSSRRNRKPLAGTLKFFLDQSVPPPNIYLPSLALPVSSEEQPLTLVDTTRHFKEAELASKPWKQQAGRLSFATTKQSVFNRENAVAKTENDNSVSAPTKKRTRK